MFGAPFLLYSPFCHVPTSEHSTKGNTTPKSCISHDDGRFPSLCTRHSCSWGPPHCAFLGPQRRQCTRRTSIPPYRRFNTAKCGWSFFVRQSPSPVIDAICVYTASQTLTRSGLGTYFECNGHPRQVDPIFSHYPHHLWQWGLARSLINSSGVYPVLTRACAARLGSKFSLGLKV